MEGLRQIFSLPHRIPSTPAQGRVLRIAHITRAMVRADPDTLYVFGDNMGRRGSGGQAKEMRGEPNAVGVPTKWAPHSRPDAYFTDADLLNRDVWHAIRTAFDEMRGALANGRDVVVPADGIGTGLAQLPTRAPRMHSMIEAAIASLEQDDS
jgi:hypothetical protein